MLIKSHLLVIITGVDVHVNIFPIEIAYHSSWGGECKNTAEFTLFHIKVCSFEPNIHIQIIFPCKLGPNYPHKLCQVLFGEFKQVSFH